MCQEFCSRGWGESSSVHAGIPHPWEQTFLQGPAPPSRLSQDQAHPPWSTHSPVQCMLGDTVNKQAVCTLLECNLVLFCKKKEKKTGEFFTNILPTKCLIKHVAFQFFANVPPKLILNLQGIILMTQNLNFNKFEKDSDCHPKRNH